MARYFGKEYTKEDIEDKFIVFEELLKLINKYENY
jgi:hypothetical protein